MFSCYLLFLSAINKLEITFQLILSIKSYNYAGHLKYFNSNCTFKIHKYIFRSYFYSLYKLQEKGIISTKKLNKYSEMNLPSTDKVLLFHMQVFPM